MDNIIVLLLQSDVSSESNEESDEETIKETTKESTIETTNESPEVHIDNKVKTKRVLQVNRRLLRDTTDPFELPETQFQNFFR